MLVRPELRALREDDIPLRHAQAEMVRALAAWRNGRLGSGIEQSLAAYARGEGLEHLPPLARLFAPGDGSAARLAADFAAPFVAILAAMHWGQVPVPAKLDDSTATIVLATAGNAMLALQAIDGSRLALRAAALTASFSPGETRDRVLAGTASGRLVELTGEAEGRAALAISPIHLAEDEAYYREGASRSLLVDKVASTLVILRLQRRPATGTVTREFNLADGTLAHQAAANPRESRLELAAALLGRMGRSDAAPLLAAMAEERGAASLRWQSLRECLGLDTAAGFAALGRIADRQADELAAPAAALRAQLLETYPQLEGIA